MQRLVRFAAGLITPLSLLVFSLSGMQSVRAFNAWTLVPQAALSFGVLGAAFSSDVKTLAGFPFTGRAIQYRDLPLSRVSVF
ncbi:hypothetical protein AU504_08075 [Lonsdalea populi]|nr:hypothetical protein AU508_10455 [Lonsdalea populi]RAT70366.1 hypothetical protein AU504_08075 [Lonsdalea populi]RAT72308.1 hypothetical protein AU505_06910 [Lonsdalea populi]RAT75023.1 hypothetical protein AU506_11185 [Lonsdalea populi]RAT78656.1 hypothetical protein AU507_07950 [Lonsdalea populi]